MPYWENQKVETDVTVSDDELLRHEIDDVNKRIKKFEDRLSFLNSYRESLIKIGTDAIVEKDMTRNMLKMSKESWARWTEAMK